MVGVCRVCALAAFFPPGGNNRMVGLVRGGPGGSWMWWEVWRCAASCTMLFDHVTTRKQALQGVLDPSWRWVGGWVGRWVPSDGVRVYCGCGRRSLWYPGDGFRRGIRELREGYSY